MSSRSPSPPLNRRRHNHNHGPSNRMAQHNGNGQQHHVQFSRGNQQGNAGRACSNNNPQASLMDDQDAADGPMNLLRDDSDCESSFERMRVVSSGVDDEVNDEDIDEPEDLDEDQHQAVAIFYEENARGSSRCSRRNTLDRSFDESVALSAVVEPVTHHASSNAHPPLHNALAVARSYAAGSLNNPMHDWQATKHTLKERFSFMFCNEILADIHFIVGRGDQSQRIPAHKFVLSVGSAVFDAMFNGAMAPQNHDDIELPDVEPAAFLALLKFLYSDDFQIGPESVMTTLYTAKKYAVPALEQSCVEFLKRNLNSDNAFMLLTQARLFDEPPLAKMCLEMIDKHTVEALNAEGFTDIDLETLCVVMERDTLRIREVALYVAVVRWSTEECHRRQLPVTPENQRQALGRALQLIRFPLMSVEEFAQSAAQSGILSDREVVNLFLYFTVNPKPTVSFLDVPRCCVTGKEQVVNRFQRIEGRWGYSGTPDRIKFNVDRRIFVVGFGLYGSIHGPTEYQVTIQIIHCGSGKVLGSNDTMFQCDGSSNTFRVLFKEPVEINPTVTYIASACLKGPDSHYGTKGLRRIVHQSPGSAGITFQFTYAAGNNNGTSVEDGQIPEIIFYTKLSS